MKLFHHIIAESALRSDLDNRHNVKNKGLEMFEFAWDSKVFGLKMYVKFNVIDSEIIVYSIHKTRF